MAEYSSKNGAPFLDLTKTTSSTQPQQEDNLASSTEQVAFQNWRFCKECFPSPNTYQFYSDDYVIMDDSNFYGLTENPGGYNTAAIASASSVLWGAYGSPSVGEVVKIHTVAFGSYPARDYCIQYLGTTSTQQNPSLHWGVNHQAQYTGTFSDCADNSSPTENTSSCCGTLEFYEWQTCSDCLPHPNTYTGVRVMLDLGVTNIPSVASVPYGDPVIADASYDFWVYYGSPAVGEVVSIDQINNDGDLVHSCFEFKGVTATQQNVHNWFQAASNSTYIATFPDCPDCCPDEEPPKFCYEIGDITDPYNLTISGGAGGMVFALPFTGLNQTPYYYEVALNDIATGAQPLDSLDFYQISPYSGSPFINSAERTCGDNQGQPFSTIGTEWGGYTEQILFSTSIDFDTGISNTDNIYNHPALPAFPTHDTAANACKNYILNGKKGWFLPSLMGFHLLFTNLGLNSSFASTLNLNTDILNLGEVYWTSSAVTGYIHNPADPPPAPLIGGPDSLISYPYAWAYNTHDPSTLYSSTLPSSPPSFGANVIPRCSTLSVRPIRRFECVDITPDPYIWECNCEVAFWSWKDLHLWLDPSQPATGANYVNIGNFDHNPPGDLYLQMIAAGFSGIHSDSTIAKYGNKIWARAWKTNVSPNEFCIIEFEINTSTLSASFTQIYFSSVPTTDLSLMDLSQLFGAGAAAKDANTLITAGRYLAQINLISSGNPTIPGSFDIGGPFATHTTNLSADPNFIEACSGDLVYIPSTNNVIITTHRFPAAGGSNTHHISNYQLTTGGITPFSLTSKISVLENNIALFCYDGNIFGRFGNALPGSQSGNYQINIDSSGFITRDYQPAIFSSPPGIPNASDAASDPRCCFECGPEPPEDPCDYEVGDIGPAGGIIVAVPYMNVNTSGDPATEIVGPNVPPLQGNVYVKNLTNYYYELSPENLNNTDCASNSDMVSFWGFWSKDGTSHSCDVATNSVTADAWIPDLTLYDIPAAYGGGTLVSGPTPTTIMEYIGQGKIVNDAYKLANYPGTPWHDPSFGGVFQAHACAYPNISNNIGAFKLCWDYNLNGYDDWFLPTVGEMDFARNYTAPGTLYDSSSGGTYTQQQHNDLDYNGDGKIDYIGGRHYWTCNTYKQDGSETIVYEENWVAGGYQGGTVYVDSTSHFGQVINYPTNTLNSFNDWHAYSVSMDPMVYSSPPATPDNQYWRTISGRLDNLNVRAMRRFQCTTEYTPPNFIEYNFRYHAVSNIPFGSFIHPWPRTPGRIHGLSSSATPNPYYYANLYFVDTNAPSYKQNHIGDNHIQFFQFKKDAVNNNAMWTVGTVLKFEVHSQLEEHLGTWEYEVMHAQGCAASGCAATFVCQLVQQTVVVNGATQVDLWPSSTNVNAITGTNHLAYLKVSSATYPTNFASTFNITNYLGLGINNQFLSAPVNNNWRVVNDYCGMGDCQEWLAEFSPPASYFLYPDLSSCTDPIEFYDERLGINNPLNKELDECANPENWGLKSLLDEKNDFEEEEVKEEIREEVKEEKVKKQKLNNKEIEDKYGNLLK